MSDISDRVKAIVVEHLGVEDSKVIDGASFIDIGGASTKPGADVVDEKEEINRVIPAINAIKQHAPKAIISIDTTSSVVAEKAVASGASIVNDIS